MKTKMASAILLALVGFSAHAATLDCSIQSESSQSDKHATAVLVGGTAQVNLGQSAQYQVTASALGNLVVIIADAGEQRISSSDSPKANLRIETSGLLSEYFCEVK